MKALVKTGYACNQLCGFCHRQELRALEGTREQIHARIERARELGHSMVVLSGGEPTIRRELLEWAAHVAALGMDFGLVTNGQMLAYPDLVARLRAHRLKYVQLSLHGGTAEVHDRIVRVAAFERVRAALHNLRGNGLDLVVNTVVNAHNLDHLPAIVELAAGYPDCTFKFSMVEPRGAAARDFDDIVPRLTEVAARVRDAMSLGATRRGTRSGPRFAHDGIPFCLLPGLEGSYDDLRNSGFASMIEVDETDFFPVDERGRIRPEKCRRCALRGGCPGLYRMYYERRGDDEIAPVTDRPRSNSFHYAFERSIAGPAVVDCPLLALGVQPWDAGRTLLVRDRRGVSLYRSRTRDFTDGEIHVVKHSLGQIYTDVSGKPALDCFADDLVKLERSSWCVDCPERERCTGVYEPSRVNAFADDDEAVRALVAAMRGDLLDVGCGDGRYGELLEPLVSSGQVRYLGIDTDPMRVQRLSRRWPWAEVRELAAEASADLEGRRFDWISMLRSWNHLRDPDAALSGLVPLLREGGCLVIADSAAFGLARSREQAASAERSVAGFEHWRNHTAAEADGVVSRHGLVRVEIREVTPATSSEWLLVYRWPGH